MRLALPPPLLASAAAMVLAGCAGGTTVDVDTVVPTPLVSPAPLAVGVRYAEGFEDYVYQEDTPDRPGWSVALGRAQAAMFDRVLGALFERTARIGSGDPTPVGLDAVLSVRLDSLQLATPGETGLAFHEAWLRYLLSLREPAGASIADWSVTAYGRASTGYLAGNAEGLHAALSDALRDLGAKLSVELGELPELRRWSGHR